MEHNILKTFFWYKIRILTTVLLILRFALLFTIIGSLAYIPFEFAVWKITLSATILLLAFHLLSLQISYTIDRITNEQVVNFNIYLNEMKKNRKFIKKYGKYYPNLFFNFHETPTEILEKLLIGLTISVNGHEIKIDDSKKSKYVLKEISNDIENYRLINGVFKFAPENGNKTLIEQLSIALFY